jgi:hypothetical protein
LHSNGCLHSGRSENAPQPLLSARITFVFVDLSVSLRCLFSTTEHTIRFPPTPWFGMNDLTLNCFGMRIQHTNLFGKVLWHQLPDTHYKKRCRLSLQNVVLRAEVNYARIAYDEGKSSLTTLMCFLEGNNLFSWIRWTRTQS